MLATLAEPLCRFEYLVTSAPPGEEERVWVSDRYLLSSFDVLRQLIATKNEGHPKTVYILK